MASEYPVTVDAALRLLKTMVDEDDRVKNAHMHETELINLHFGLGAWIRNNLGLYAGNAQLLSAAETAEPDDASMVIIKAFWNDLRSELPRIH